MKKLRVNTYAVVCRAVEEGIAYGWTRAHKHSDKPSKEHIMEQVEKHVIDALCEYIVFEEAE